MYINVLYKKHVTFFNDTIINNNNTINNDKHEKIDHYN